MALQEVMTSGTLNHVLLSLKCLCRQRKLKREVEKHKLFEDYLIKVLEIIPKGMYVRSVRLSCHLPALGLGRGVRLDLICRRRTHKSRCRRGMKGDRCQASLPVNPGATRATGVAGENSRGPGLFLPSFLPSSLSTYLPSFLPFFLNILYI